MHHILPMGYVTLHRVQLCTVKEGLLWEKIASVIRNAEVRVIIVIKVRSHAIGVHAVRIFERDVNILMTDTAVIRVRPDYHILFYNFLMERC